MELIKKIESKFDSTLKYVFNTDDDLIIEFSYIDKNDGKDIICIPSQTMCNLACKFCHTTDYIGKIKVRNLTDDEILFGINYIIVDLKLKEGYNNSGEFSNRYGFVITKTELLISVMGVGEPILNVDNIISAMTKLKSLEKDGIPFVRFAIATSLPKYNCISFFMLTELIKLNDLPVKIHFSLHYTNDKIRKECMPSSLDIFSSLAAMDFYKKYTGNPVEIHYALIKDVNDTEQDAILLTHYLKNKDIAVKFLFYNEKDSINYHASNKNKVKIFKHHFEQWNIPFEYYIPPGLDIGASCGMFLMDNYIKK